MIPAIILAAGASSRMGRTKALLPLPGGMTFLGHVAATIRSAGVEEIVAVVGRDADAIRQAIGREAPSVRLIENLDPSRGQLSSLQVGLEALGSSARGSTEQSGPPPAVLVTTVDLPLVRIATVMRVIRAWQSSRAPIVRPVHKGRHGHPVIFGATLFQELLAADLQAGARVVVRAHESEGVDVPVDDPYAFDDIDTPEDYERLVGPLP